MLMIFVALIGMVSLHPFISEENTEITFSNLEEEESHSSVKYSVEEELKHYINPSGMYFSVFNFVEKKEFQLQYVVVEHDLPHHEIPLVPPESLTV